MDVVFFHEFFQMLSGHNASMTGEAKTGGLPEHVDIMHGVRIFLRKFLKRTSSIVMESILDIIPVISLSVQLHRGMNTAANAECCAAETESYGELRIFHRQLFQSAESISTKASAFCGGGGSHARRGHCLQFSRINHFFLLTPG